MRKFTSILAGAVATLMVAVVVPAAVAPSASALSGGLGFTADNLPTWQANGTVWATAGVGSTVFAGGTFSQVRPPDGTSGTPITVANFTSYNAATGQPGSCRPQVTFGSNAATVRALTLSPDGKTLYIGGNFSAVGGVTALRVAALDVATCTVKTTFRPQLISSTVRSISATDDTVYLAGDFQSVAGAQRLSFAAVSASTGALLPFVADTELRGWAVSAGRDGSTVAIGGDFFTVNGQDSHGFAVVDATTGANVRNYPAPFIPNTSVIKGITADDTGYYVGAEGTGGGVFDGSFAIDYGTFDQRWRDLCLGATQALLVHDEIVYEANHHHDCEANNRGEFTDGLRVYLTANRVDTDEMLAWRPQLNDGLGEKIGPRSLAVAASGSTEYLWVGGEFTLVNGQPQQSITRFASGPDTGAPVTPTVRAESLKAGQVRVSWRSSFDSDDGRLTYRVYRNGSSTPLATIEGDSRWWVRPQVSFLDTSVNPGTTYTYRVTASDGTNTSSQSPAASVQVRSSDQPYASAVLGDGAQTYWRYDEASGRYGTNSGPGSAQVNYMNAVTYRGEANAALDDTGYAMTFDGSTSYAYDEQTAAAPSVYSVETWFKTTTTRGGKIIGFGNGLPNTGSNATRSSGSYDRHVYMTNAGRLIFGTWTGSASTIQSAAAYNDGQWHHVVANQGPGGMALYVDGIRVGKNANSVAQAYRGSWRVGGDNLSGWPSRPSSDYFAGQIDETAVYPTVLSGSQVLAHYEASGRTAAVQPAPADAYGAAVYSLDPDLYWRFDETSGAAQDAGRYGVTGTYTTTNRVQQGVAGFVPGGSQRAVQFNPNGSGNSNGADLASSVQFSNPSDYSLELWFQTSTTRGGKLIGFGDNATALSSNYDRHVYMQDDGKLVFGVWTGSASTITTPQAYNNGEWHHVVATQSSTTGMSLYVDGILVGTDPQTGAQSYAGYWKVGGDVTWGSTWPFFSGRIDEAAVYSTVLTQGQVGLHYALGTGATPPDAVPPTAPTGLTATANGETDVDLSWTAATDDTAVTGYAVHRSTTEGFTPTPATLVADVTGTSYADTDLAADTYYYVVTARDAAGNVSPPSEQASVVVVGPDVTAPSAPADLTATAGETGVALSWTAATDDRAVSGYTVHRSTAAGFTPSSATKVTDVTQTSYEDGELEPGTYYYVVTASDAAGNVGEPSEQATAEVLGPDTQAPSAPTDLTAHVTGSTVALSWTASTDDRGVTGYAVHRSTTPGFTPSSGTHLADVTGTSYSNTSVDPGTYYYVVVASDAAGNTSEPAAQATATVVPPPAEPVTVTLSPTADTMVNQGAPTTQYGTTNQLSARSGNPLVVSYLKFDIPAVPTGTTLSSATLTLRTTTSASAGSVDPYDLVWADNGWNETSTLYASRPALSSTVVGTLAGGSQPSTTYGVTLSPSAFAGTFGSTRSIGVTSTSTDNIWFWSREVNVASYRPVLTLTFTAAP